MRRTVKDINGIPCQYLITDKFKSVIVSVKFIGQFTAENLNSRALLPNMLTGASRHFHDRSLIERELAWLYGTDISTSHQKIGYQSVISFDMTLVNEKYLPERPEIFDRAFSLLADIIYNPKLINGSLKKGLFDREKRLLMEEIAGEYNDKFAYGYRLFKNRMFENELFRLSPRGDLDSLSRLTIDDINQEYRRMLCDNQLELHVSGDFSEDQMDHLIRKHIHGKTSPVPLSWLDTETKTIDEVKMYHEAADITQTRIYMGYRSEIRNTNRLYYPIRIMNIILGDSDQSLLFQMIRENEQLSYDVSSTYIANKGVLLVFAGVEPGNETRTLDQIHKAIKRLTIGDISADDLQLAKAVYLKRLRQEHDSLQQILQRAFFYQALFNKEYILEESIRQTEAVTLDDVIEAMQSLKADTVFFYGKKAGERYD